jgi:Domain of unknown function (DUF4396)
MQHEHAGHGHGRERAPTSLNRTAFAATWHCLTGCAIGEILGLVIATALGWGNLASIGLAVVLAFFFGYLLTLRPLVRGGVSLREATRVAVAADTVSIAIMEIVDNGFVLLVPGAMDAGLGDVLFWSSLIVGLFIAFWAAFPVNRVLIARGRGHAVVHAYH